MNGYPPNTVAGVSSISAGFQEEDWPDGGEEPRTRQGLEAVESPPGPQYAGPIKVEAALWEPDLSEFQYGLKTSFFSKTNDDESRAQKLKGQDGGLGYRTDEAGGGIGIAAEPDVG